MPITHTLAPAGLLPTPPAPPVDASRLPKHRGVLIILFLFGVVLPLVTNLVELATHMCAASFFDPLPTLGHVFAVFLVPLAAMASLRALWRRDGERLEATMFAQAFATAIAAVYALIFAPLTPLALMAVPHMAIGILPLAPALSVLAGVRALFALRRLRIALGRPPRRVGSRDLMLRACYLRPTSATTDIGGALINVAIPVPPEKMRDIYYQVTGRPFDTEPQPLVGGRFDGATIGRW